MMGFYPRGTRFGLLAMDFDFMGAGKAEYDYLEQLKGLEDIARDYAGAAFPFVALDPRREGLAELAIDCVERRGFQGFKIYPPFGYFPFDEALDPLLAYAEERGLPVITHCSFGSPLTYWRGPITAAMRVHPKTGERLLGRRGREFASNWSAPANYRYVLERHPRLRLCLGHMGGAVEWRNFLYTSWPGKSVQEPPPAGAGTWLETVIELMREYEGVYADIAYTAYDPVLLPLLKVLLADERLASRILFGSDSYMLQMDAGEREFSIRLRGYLGEKLFRKIADENPRSWLGEAGTRD
jgi:predicted TIM-barrel fold metal-dependent hydrolase